MNTQNVRDRQQNIRVFFVVERDLEACSNTDGLMESLDIEYKHTQWTLFIDTSKINLKLILLHKGNIEPSVPFWCVPHIKETTDNMKHMLTCIKYDQHQCHLCGVLIHVAIEIVLQAGYTEFCCFLCEWDSCARDISVEYGHFVNHWNMEGKYSTSTYH